MNIRRTLIMAMVMLGLSSVKVYANDIEYIQGENRYETAALIANKMSYDDAILVNGTALVDGLSASGLSGALNAPILLTQTNTIPQVTLNALSGVDTVYIVGGEGVVSESVENQLKNMGISVVRVGGTNRYATSFAVADEIEKYKSISQVYYVNGINGQADAMSIAPVAAKNGNPVILTDGNSTTYNKNVESFIIGGTGVMGKQFDSYGERLGGKTRFETNKNVINRFFDDKSQIYLSKSTELVDALTSSALKSPVVLVDNNSDKSIIAGAKNVTALGDIDKKAIARARSYIYGDKVVFYTQHQDDETLFAGSTIVDAIESVGKENVYIVLFTKGNKSSVFDSDRYKDLTDDEKATLRNNEFDAAVQSLGIDANNIVKLNQNEYEIDYKVLSTFIEDFESKYKNVTHITHSYKYDIHTEHMQTGQVFYDLYNAGKISDVRFFARTDEGSNIPVDYLIESVSDTEYERDKVIQACNEYKLDNGDMIREGIGYKSVQGMFDNLINDSKNTSYLHKPGA